VSTEFFLPGMKAHREGGGRLLLSDNTGNSRLCCGRSRYSVLDVRYQLDSLVYKHVFDHMYTQFRLAPHNPECYYSVKRGDSVLYFTKSSKNGLL
jgi:hypothetical protein